MVSQSPTGIFVKLTYFPFAFLYSLCTPIVVIDGEAYKTGWGSRFFEVPAGRHFVKIYFSYLFWSECGANAIDVVVTDGQVSTLEYYMPVWAFESGKIKLVLSEDSKCYFHPEINAVTRCTNCGKAICQSCSGNLSGRVVCQECSGVLSSSQVNTENKTGYSSQGQRPEYVTSSISPETEGAASTALWLEILLGIFGLLGVGHVYTGRIAVGIVAMISWWIYIGVALSISSATLGIAGCLCGPIYLAVPIISGIQAHTYMKQKGGTGSWQSVGMIAGGGCLLIIIAIVIIVVALGGLGVILGSSY